MILYDAARCPYCARARIVLAEKGLGYETVEIDLSDRPAWLYEKNPRGKVPVLEEEDGFVLPESAVIMEYLNGQDLEQAVSQAALTLEDFYQVAQQMLDALSNAHRMNLLHRDIKPSNIQVTWLANGVAGRYADRIVAYTDDCVSP